MPWKILLCLLPIMLTAAARPWTDEVMYFALVDRFCDGDPANNVPAGSDPALHDPAQREISHYLGGDLRGLENAIRAGYFRDLGVTALWLTPVVRNVWRSGYDAGGWKSGYHGYWAQDWLDIDPHLTSARSLAGTPYPDNAEGRQQHYRDFVALAHANGLRVIQDAVLNHAGPVFFYDVDGDGRFDTADKNEWIQPFRRAGHHDNARWADIPRWNLARTQPDGPRRLLGREIATGGVLAELASYGRKGFSPDSLGKADGEEIECDFFSLRDLWTDPASAHFDRLVDEFVEIYGFYLTAVGVDGLRVDTVKHVHPRFWDEFTARLRKRLGAAAADKLVFGEVYDGDPRRLGGATWRTDWRTNPAPALDSVLDFHVCFAAREWLRRPGAEFGSPAALERAVMARSAAGEDGRPLFNPNPGADGLNAQQKLVTFIENHDGLNRFRVAGVTAERNRLAQALVLTLPGIPCLYYGTEFALADGEGRIGHDGETGRRMAFRRQGGPAMADVRKSAEFREIAALTRLRARLPELRSGRFFPLWVDSPASDLDDGVFAFARGAADGGTFVVVAANASDRPRQTTDGSHEIRLPAELRAAGMTLVPVFASGSGAGTAALPADGPLRLPVPAGGLVIYHARPAG